MKIGFNLLLWSTYITEEDFPTIEKLKATGYDGVEIPTFDVSDLGHYQKIGSFLRDQGLSASTVTVAPDESTNPISVDKANRQNAIDRLKRVVDASHAVGSDILCGPFYQVLGKFTGVFPTEEERDRAAEVHLAVADHAASAGVTLAFEWLNRFEAYLFNTTEDAANYVRKHQHPNLKTMFDTFHANIEEKDPIKAAIDNMDAIAHLHISENDRGTPGRGHLPLVETIQAFKKAGYDRWITIEAFGAALPELVEPTKVWRNFFPDREQVYTEGYQLIRNAWDQAS